MKKILLIIFIFLWPVSWLLAQEKRIISINSDILKTSYEKLSEEAFNKLWEESVGQQLKITLLDQTVKIQLLLGGGVVPFDELKEIPELASKMNDGTFPKDRIFMKHVCQLEIGVNGNIKTLLEAGVSFPYRVTFIESLSSQDGKDPSGIKKRTLIFFKNYIEMMLNRFDKSILTLENSLLPREMVLKTGEQFSAERFLLGTIGLGSELFEFNADNPILSVRGKANFKALKFTKVFAHLRLTVQNFGPDDNYRVTISRKKINTLELLNMEFGFDVKTKKKLFKLLRLGINLNLFKFNPTWNFYNFRHRQFTGKFENIKAFTNVKRSYFLGENNFLDHQPDTLEFYRTYQIKGHSFTNDLNVFNLYRNSHQEKIENRYIDTNMNTRENIGVGNFSRFKSSLFNFQKMSLDISCDYTYHLNRGQGKDDRSGLMLKFRDNDNQGINETRAWYLAYTRKILEELYADSTSELDFLLKNADNDQFQRDLKIEFDAQAYNILLHDKKNIEAKIHEAFLRIFDPKDTDSEYSKWRKDYIRVMLKRTIDRIYVMDKMLDLQFSSVAQKKFSLNRLKTPGQLPMRDVIYLLIATAVAKDHIAFEYTINRIPEQNSLLEYRKSKTKYQFNYQGKNFVNHFDTMNFYY